VRTHPKAVGGVFNTVAEAAAIRVKTSPADHYLACGRTREEMAHLAAEDVENREIVAIEDGTNGAAADALPAVFAWLDAGYDTAGIAAADLPGPGRSGGYYGRPGKR
jgi:hypothetical protein